MLRVTLPPARSALLAVCAARYGAALAAAIAASCLLPLLGKLFLRSLLFGTASLTGLLRRSDSDLGAVNAEALGDALAVPFPIVGFSGVRVLQWHAESPAGLLF